MKPSTLRRIGRALYGRHGWIRQLAESLKRDERTIDRWSKGEFRIPHSAATQCRNLLLNRRKEIYEILSELMKP